jgi:hypothetical protein
MSFIEEKFIQANVRSKYNDLALERTKANITKFYDGRVLFHEDQLDLFIDLQHAVLQELNARAVVPPQACGTDYHAEEIKALLKYQGKI